MYTQYIPLYINIISYTVHKKRIQQHFGLLVVNINVELIHNIHANIDTFRVLIMHLIHAILHSTHHIEFTVLSKNYLRFL